MKTQLLAVAAAVTVLASCTKEYTTVNVAGEPYRPAFRVSGISDLTFEKTPFGNPSLVYMPLQVVYDHGESQKVTLQLSGVPQGIRDTMPISSGYPDFSTNAIFYYEGAANGDYPIKLSAKADTGKAQEYSFTIKVKGDTSCSGYLTGTPYRTTSTCSGGAASFENTLSKNGTGGDTMYINNFENNNSALMCLISCRMSQINIPNQVLMGSTYSGYGYLNTGQSGSGIALNLTIFKKNNTTQVTTNCTYYMSRN
ncbi:MAG: hypothetical protein EOP52_10995 [Sphingobacteriales bacterium]|nr:MAG: hypothetical protein EOP52_10995 [Sphingobacteriales bacterium]